MTNDTLEPVPDFVEYQDQAIEIDNLTNRIDNLIKALKVAGVYDSSQKNLARLLDEGHENQLIPVPNWAAFGEKGGLANLISFLPIKEISEVLMTLFEARDKIKNDLYEITGIADIMRGQADPRETASAIQNKGRWGSLRLQQRQAEVARFCRDIIKMMGEIISEHYPDQTLIQVSGILFDEGIGPEPPTPPALTPPPVSPPGAATQGGPPAPPIGSAPTIGGQGASPAPPPNPMMAVMQYQQQMMQWQKNRQDMINKAIQLLRNDKLRGFRIDIETDSTINDDAKEEKAERVEFLTALSGFVEKAMQAAQSYPDMIPLLGKSILFTVRGFRVGRDLESTIEEFIDKAQADAKKAATMPKPPSPEQIKAQADMAMAQASIQEAQLKMQGDQQRSQAEVQAQQVQAQSNSQDMQMKQQLMEMEMQLKQLEAQLKQRELDQKAAFQQSEHNYKMQQLELESRSKMADHMAQERSRQMEASMQVHAANTDALAREHEARTSALSREHEATIGSTVAAHQAELKAHDAKLKMRDKYPRKPLPKTPDVPEAPELPSHPLTSEQGLTPEHGSPRKAPDGKWYVNDPNRKGKYMRVDRS